MLWPYGRTCLFSSPTQTFKTWNICLWRHGCVFTGGYHSSSMLFNALQDLYRLYFLWKWQQNEQKAHLKYINVCVCRQNKNDTGKRCVYFMCLWYSSWCPCRSCDNTVIALDPVDEGGNYYIMHSQIMQMHYNHKINLSKRFLGDKSLNEYDLY